LIIAKLEEFIRNKMITIYSIRTINEIKTFVWNNGKPQSMRGYNDDLVMSIAIACWVRDTVITTSKRDIKYATALLDSMVFANTRLSTTIPGMHGHKREESLQKTEKEMMQQSEFMWLYKG